MAKEIMVNQVQPQLDRQALIDAGVFKPESSGIGFVRTDMTSEGIAVTCESCGTTAKMLPDSLPPGFLDEDGNLRENKVVVCPPCVHRHRKRHGA